MKSIITLFTALLAINFMTPMAYGQPKLPPPTDKEWALMFDDSCSDPQASIAAFEKYKDEDLSYHYGTLAEIYGQCFNDTETEIEYYKKAVEVNGGASGMAAYAIGQVYVDLKDLDKAVKWSKKAYELGYGGGAWHIALVAEMRDENYVEAAKWYERAVELEETDMGHKAFSYQSLAPIMYYHLKDYKKALEYYGEAKSSTGNKALRSDFHYGLLNSYARLSNIERFDILVPAINPEVGVSVPDKDKLFELAETLQEMNEPVRAMGIYYATIAFELATLDEVNQLIEKRQLHLTLEQKEQAKTWQNEVMNPVYAAYRYPYTGELE